MLLKSIRVAPALARALVGRRDVLRRVAGRECTVEVRGGCVLLTARSPRELARAWEAVRQRLASLEKHSRPAEATARLLRGTVCGRGVDYAEYVGSWSDTEVDVAHGMAMVYADSAELAWRACGMLNREPEVTAGLRPGAGDVFCQLHEQEHLDTVVVASTCVPEDEDVVYDFGYGVAGQVAHEVLRRCRPFVVPPQLSRLVGPRFWAPWGQMVGYVPPPAGHTGATAGCVYGEESERVVKEIASAMATPMACFVPPAPLLHGFGPQLREACEAGVAIVPEKEHWAVHGHASRVGDAVQRLRDAVALYWGSQVRVEVPREFADSSGWFDSVEMPRHTILVANKGVVVGGENEEACAAGVDRLRAHVRAVERNAVYVPVQHRRVARVLLPPAVRLRKAGTGVQVLGTDRNKEAVQEAVRLLVQEAWGRSPTQEPVLVKKLTSRCPRMPLGLLMTQPWFVETVVAPVARAHGVSFEYAPGLEAVVVAGATPEVREVAVVHLQEKVFLASHQHQAVSLHNHRRGKHLKLSVVAWQEELGGHWLVDSEAVHIVGSSSEHAAGLARTAQRRLGIAASTSRWVSVTQPVDAVVFAALTHNCRKRLHRLDNVEVVFEQHPLRASIRGPRKLVDAAASFVGTVETGDAVALELPRTLRYTAIAESGNEVWVLEPLGDTVVVAGPAAALNSLRALEETRSR